MRGRGHEMYAEGIGASPLPRRGFWIAALLCDAILLFFAGHLVSLAGILLLFGALALMVLHAEWLLAFFVLGMPLLYPLELRTETTNVVLLASRALYLPAWWISCGRASRERSETGAAFPGWFDTAARAFAAPVTWLVLALALLLWVRLPASPAPLYGAGKTHAFLVSNVALFLAPVLLWPLWMRAGLDRLMRALLVVGGLFAAAGLAHAFGWASLGWGRGGFDPATGVASRLGWLGLDPIWSARALALWLVLLAWAASRRRLRWPLALALALPALWLLLGTGSRGPLAALLISPVALLLLPASGLRRGGPARVLAWSAAAALVLAILIAVMPAGERERLSAILMRAPQGTDLGLGSSSGDSGGILRDPSSLYRRLVLARGFTLLEEALPWGAGTGAFPALLFLRDVRLYPHNIEAELLLEQGWPGLLLFLLFVAVVWKQARRLVAADACYLWPALLFAMAFVNAQVSGDLSANAEIWFWGGVICGAGIAALRRDACADEALTGC